MSRVQDCGDGVGAIAWLSNGRERKGQGSRSYQQYVLDIIQGHVFSTDGIELWRPHNGSVGIKRLVMIINIFKTWAEEIPLLPPTSLQTTFITSRFGPQANTALFHFGYLADVRHSGARRHRQSFEAIESYDRRPQPSQNFSRTRASKISMQPRGIRRHGRQ